MPLSKCRICGKKVPNPYRPYHEKYQCLEMKRRKGLLIWREELPHVKKQKEITVEKGQCKLLEFIGVPI